MSNKEAVKKHRKRVKNKMVEAMGGCCQVCGYNKCNSALEFHHIIPGDKDITFSKISSHNIAWNKIVKELRKCILLCANCHREIHANITDLPKTYTTFLDEYTDLRKYKDLYDKCPVCGNKKSKQRKTCSHSCAGKLSGKIDWENIDLYQLMLDTDVNFTRMGDILGCSDNAVRKRAKKLGLWY